MTTWWQEHQELAGQRYFESMEPLNGQLVALLDDVDARFTAAGGDSMGWPDPHAVPGEPMARRETQEDEYSRVTNPGKYRILDVRVSAWIDALRAAELADMTCQRGTTAMDFDVHWPGSGMHPPARIITLTPRARAPRLHVASWADSTDGCLSLEGALKQADVAFQVAVDDPPAIVLRTPDCGCDACDSGSADLLEELDRWLLSIVDGSFLLHVGGGTRELHTSFHSESGTMDESSSRRTIVGQSWWPGAIPRRVMRW